MLIIALVAVAVPVALALVPRLPVPGAVLEVVAGILIGPSLLGWVHVDAPIQVLSDLGLGMLLFLAGLEIDVEGLRGPLGRLAGWAFGGSVLLGLACGYGAEPGRRGRQAGLPGGGTDLHLGRAAAAAAQGRRPAAHALRAAGDDRRRAGRSGHHHDAVPAVLRHLEDRQPSG